MKLTAFTISRVQEKWNIPEIPWTLFKENIDIIKGKLYCRTCRKMIS